MIRLLATSPENYAIRVDGGTMGAQAIGTDGRVTLDVPSLSRGCDVYFFFLKVSSAESAFDHKAIRVYKGIDIINSMSLNDLAKLPNDSDGYRLLRVAR